MVTKNNNFLNKLKTTLIICIVSLILFVGINAIILYQPFVGEGSLKTTSSVTFFSLSEKLKEYTKSLSEMDRTTDLGREGVVQYLITMLQKLDISECELSTKWCYTLQEYSVSEEKHKNIIVKQRESRDEEIYIVGAHYDSFHNLPGADDNASGVAGVLELVRLITQNPDSVTRKNIEFVFYSSEEPPYYATNKMGSYVHAESLNAKNIQGVLILEMIGYYSEDIGSQGFPLGILRYLYSDRGNFIALISKNDLENIKLTRSLKKSMKSFLSKNKLIDVSSMNAPRFITGIDFSDHRNYWAFDIPALMITDTSFYRNRAYHTLGDTYERLDYEKMKEVVDGVFYYLSTLSK